jgi:Domain of unknown function (DUF5916)/Carbohydrate family 9 binding domain-like
MRAVIAAGLALVAGIAGAAAAEVPPPPAPIGIVRVETPPVVDGRLDDAAWRTMTPVVDFWKMRPVDDQSASERTEAWITYDSKNLYVAFRAYDSQPGSVRASLSPRDQCNSDDIVGVLLDTFHDRRRAYELFVNPLGVQMDGVTVEGQNDDYTVDFVWITAGRRTADGFDVEMAIPFRSLRFSAASPQTWGVTFIRIVPRLGEQDVAPRIDRAKNCVVCQLGEVTGLSDISPGRTFELLPTVTGLRHGAEDPVQSGFVQDQAHYEAGLGLKLGLTPSLTLDATGNPDFSQVETDAAQVTVNQRFALFFPEKRPFFLEGQEIFASPLQLVYTRNLYDPLAATKLTGKLGGTTVGVLGAVDEHPFIPAGDAPPPGGIDPNRTATFGVMRLKQDIGGKSSLGVLATDREFGASFNRLAGLDGQVKFLERWTWAFQGVGSDTRNLDGRRLGGSAFSSEVARGGEHFELDVLYHDLSPDFRADAGFIRRRDLREGEVFVAWEEKSDHALLRRLRPSFDVRQLYDHADVKQEAELTPRLHLEFPRKVTWEASNRFRTERFAGADFQISRFDTYLDTEPWKALTGGAEWNEGDEIHYDPADPYLAWGRQLDLWTTLRPSDRFSLRTDLTRATEWHRRGGAQVFRVDLARALARYQFTRSIALRTIVQWQSVDETGDPVRDLDLNVLASFTPGPGTVFYLGYDDGVNDPADGTPAREFHLARRALFFKVSYLWRT